MQQEINKILLVGGSLANPRFFNQTILGKDEDDVGSMQYILEDLYQVPVKTLAINGTGNGWARDGVLSHLHEIDNKTLVIVMWATVDRVDQYINPSIDQSQLDMSSTVDSNCPHIFNTFSVSGEQSDSGQRFWVSANYNVGLKRELNRLVYSEANQLKEMFESIALVQHVLKSKNAQQIHITIHDLLTTRSRALKTFIKRQWGEWTPDTEAEYRQVDVSQMTTRTNILDENPQLIPWYNLVDWSLFAKRSMTAFFSEEHLPWYAGRGPHNSHQAPYNYFRFIAEEIAALDSIEQHDFEYRMLTKEFCELYNVKYPNLF